jgi:Flp pilus assembly protein TadB
MASPKSKRKRRNPSSPPRAVLSQRREQRIDRTADADRSARRAQRQLGTEGERPQSPFGGVPVSEIAIFAGLVALVVWLIRGGTPTLVVGLVVIVLGVLEVTGREHFSGYRSHTTLLASIPAVALAIGVISFVGDRADRAPLMVVIAGPVYAFLFWQLRKRFMAARQARVARLPSAGARP